MPCARPLTTLLAIVVVTVAGVCNVEAHGVPVKPKQGPPGHYLPLKTHEGHFQAMDALHRRLEHTAKGDTLGKERHHPAHRGGDYVCGSTHTDMPETEAIVQAEEYHNMDHYRRRMQFDPDQDYLRDPGGSFLSVNRAFEAGLSTPMRIGLIWDALDYGDFSGDNAGFLKAYQCIAVGETILVGCSAGGSPDCSTVCVDYDVVAPGNSKHRLIKQRVQYAADFFRDSLHVKPIQDTLDIHPTLVSSYHINTTSLESTDLAIIITAHPAPFTPVAAYARCLQRDQFHRCTVGQFNWVPAALDPDLQTSPDVISAERHTALHEIMHILGGMAPSDLFIDDTGTSLTTGVYTTVNTLSFDYPKPTTYITTPKVVELAREHYGCPNLVGLPLEDLPLGKGSHWEARIMGPEFMSYGTGTGESYFSDFTFAFLEDTNQYVANYSYGGPMLQREDAEPMKIGTLFFASAEIVEDEEEPPYRSPGTPRWGKNQARLGGCDFVLGSAAGWSSLYKCEQTRAFGCSFDNRMAVVCTINTDYVEEEEFSCGSFTNGVASCSGTIVNDNCFGSVCGLPRMYQYYDTDAQAVFASGQLDAESGNTGGHSSAMDYAPTSLSYWNCQDTGATVSSNGTRLVEGGTEDLAEVGQEAQDEMPLFGGQSRCPNCRCFISSLVELSSASFNPTFPSFGLCYRSNCYKADYLQIGIKSQLTSEVFWYKCPPNGGKLFIPGFSGVFTCPVASEFCSMEKVTHIKFPETLIWLEWLIWSLILGLPMTFSFCCLCVPPFREHIVVVFKKMCGVGHFALLAPLDPRSRLTVIKVRREKCVHFVLAFPFTPFQETIELAQKRHNKPKRVNSESNMKAAAEKRRRNRRRSWAGADLMGRSLRGLNLAVQAYKAGSGPSAATMKEARRISMELKAAAAVKGNRDKLQGAEQEVSGTVRANAGGRKITLQQNTGAGKGDQGDLYDRLRPGKSNASDHHIPRRSSAGPAPGRRQWPREHANQEDAPQSGVPDWAKALRPDEFGEEGMDALCAIRDGARFAVPESQDVVAATRRKQQASKLHGGIMAARAGQRLAQRARANIKERRRGQHRGWQAVREWVWIPNEFGKTRFRADVLKEVVKSKGRKRKAIMARARKRVTPGNHWKKGSVTVIESRLSKALFTVSLILSLAGAAVAGLAMLAMGQSSVTSFPVLVCSTFVVILGYLGMKGARKSAEVASCVVVTYFYLVLCLVIVFAFANVWLFCFPSSMDRFLAENWNVVTGVFPKLASDGVNVTEAVVDFREGLSGRTPLFSSAVAGVAIVLGSALVASARLLRMDVLFGSLFTVCHNVYIGLSVVLLGLGAFWSSRPGSVANQVTIPIICAAMFLYLLVSATVAHIAAFRKKPLLMKGYFMATILSTFGILYSVIFVLQLSTRITPILDDLTEEELLAVAIDLKLEGVAREFMDPVIVDNLRIFGTLLMFVLLLQLLIVWTAVRFLVSMARVRDLLTPAGIKKAKAEARVLMVFGVLRGEEEAYETDLLATNMRSSQDAAFSKARMAARVVGAHALKKARQGDNMGRVKSSSVVPAGATLRQPGVGAPNPSDLMAAAMSLLPEGGADQEDVVKAIMRQAQEEGERAAKAKSHMMMATMAAAHFQKAGTRRSSGDDHSSTSRRSSDDRASRRSSDDRASRRSGDDRTSRRSGDDRTTKAKSHMMMATMAAAHFQQAGTRRGEQHPSGSSRRSSDERGDRRSGAERSSRRSSAERSTRRSGGSSVVPTKVSASRQPQWG